MKFNFRTTVASTMVFMTLLVIVAFLLSFSGQATIAALIFVVITFMLIFHTHDIDDDMLDKALVEATENNKKLEKRIKELEEAIVLLGGNIEDGAAQLEKKLKGIENRIKEYEGTLTKEEKLMIKYYEAYLELEKAIKRALVYYERKKLENNVGKLEQELRVNDVDIDINYIKEFYEEYKSTKTCIEKDEV